MDVLSLFARIPVMGTLNINIHMHIYMHIYIHIYIYVYICMYAFTRVSMSVKEARRLDTLSGMRAIMTAAGVEATMKDKYNWVKEGSAILDPSSFQRPERPYKHKDPTNQSFWNALVFGLKTLHVGVLCLCGLWGPHSAELGLRAGAGAFRDFHGVRVVARLAEARSEPIDVQAQKVEVAERCIRVHMLYIYIYIVCMCVIVHMVPLHNTI